MHPYREPPPAADDEPAPLEELVLYAALIAIGGIPVIVAVLGATVFGFDATLGAMMCLVGVLGLMKRRYRRART